MERILFLYEILEKLAFDLRFSTVDPRSSPRELFDSTDRCVHVRDVLLPRLGSAMRWLNVVRRAGKWAGRFAQ